MCDAIVRLVPASVVHSASFLSKLGYSFYVRLINASTLANLMEPCQSLKVLSFERLKMDEHHCHVLGCYSTPGLEIVLMDCVIMGSGASNVAQVLGHNRGPTKLNICNTDNLDLADGY
jgi:hypothetical protein